MRRRTDQLQRRQSRLVEATRSSAATVRAATERFLNGEEFAWVALVQELSHSDPEASPNIERANADLRQLPLWMELTDEDRAAILSAAERYVRTCDPRQPGMEVWTHRSWEGWAGYRALRLLQAEAPLQLTTLTRDVWVRWAPVLVAFREGNLDDHGQPAPAPLLSHAYALVPDVIAVAARDLLGAENARCGTLLSVEHLGPIVDGTLAAVLMELLHDGPLTESALGRLLGLLLPGNFPEVRAWAESVLSPPLPKAKVGRERVLAVARALLACAPDGGWSILGPLVRKRTKFSKQVALSAAHLMVGKASLKRFDESQLAEMFRWLERHFPYADDPHYPGVYSPTASDDARHWRGNVIETLVERATPESVRELTALRIDLPHLDWLSNSVLKAREAMRRESWQSLDVEQILALGRDSRTRVVEDGDRSTSSYFSSLSPTLRRDSTARRRRSKRSGMSEWAGASARRTRLTCLMRLSAISAASSRPSVSWSGER